MSKQRFIGILAFACLALVLAACQPGGSVTGGAATGTPHSAPINVPQGYQGMVSVTFTSTTTYDQAVAILQNAGMRLQVPCPNPGPIVADPTAIARPIDQRATFAQSHKLTAVGTSGLTQSMLHQVASSPQVTAVDKVPMVECPLVP